MRLERFARRNGRISLMETVRIREVGPREGFQTLKKVIPLKDKLELISLLSKTGIKDIEIASFVRPEKVPQMADAEEIVVQYDRKPGINYTALYLNQKGFERCEALKRLDNEGWLYTAGSETFLNKNSNTSYQKILDEVPSWLEMFSKYRKKLHGLMVSTAFGCTYEGRVDPSKVQSIVRNVCDRVQANGEKFKEICLADTMGWGNPKAVREVVKVVQESSPESEITLHLHDTRGTGIANAVAGLELGVRTFDASVGGMGGCPFAPGAAGNIATEDLVFICEEMGYSTGIDLDLYVESANFASKIVGFELPGKFYKSKKLSC